MCRWTEGRVPGLVKSVYSWRTDGRCDNYNAASEAFELSQDAQWGAAGGITPPNDQVQVRPVVGRSQRARCLPRQQQVVLAPENRVKHHSSRSHASTTAQELASRACELKDGAGPLLYQALIAGGGNATAAAASLLTFRGCSQTNMNAAVRASVPGSFGQSAFLHARG